MLNTNIVCFDEQIKGTTKTWYTPAELNEVFGRSEMLILHATVTNVAGTSPQLNLAIESSVNSEDWVSLGTTPLSPLVEQACFARSFTIFGGRFVRISMTLSGTSPECRLKLGVTARTFSGGEP